MLLISFGYDLEKKKTSLKSYIGGSPCSRACFMGDASFHSLLLTRRIIAIKGRGLALDYSFFVVELENDESSSDD